MNGTMRTLSNTDDVIDVRDVIERVEELKAEWSEATEGNDPDDYALSDDDWLVGLSEDDRDELVALLELLDDLKGQGGDHQWRGDWYPVTLIHEDYFEDYAREMAEDIGAIDGDAGWPLYCIDWERAASDLRMDYTSVDFDGQTYWTR